MTMTDEFRNIGQQRLANIEPLSAGINAWKTWLQDYRLGGGHADNVYVWLACTLALESVAAGNFGVGCVLVDGQGALAVQGHNRVFTPHFRSDLHAEMVVMDEFEDAHPEPVGLEAYTLYTSLEPCPMCLVRLSTSGIGKVLYAAPDVEGGMVSRSSLLPPFWLDLAQRKTFGQAHCAQDLVHAANQIFLLNLDELVARVKAR
ncbi:nucleoside deaminase [Methylococcus sp. EFPC2]|uniref:nucleoside deaminase n=1 Tax=Methylococcus sp. EFPC2 TaxID=2812648 RepID=UPI001968100F|nr:nucleoside deaminase [Methylococcus sp. EFPC2]QSA97564.1 nucleoside deaminase [Methylococcus sp. EFPC2]